MFGKALGLLCALALAGCGGSSPDASSESTPPAQSSRVSTSPTAADLPDETATIAGQKFSLDRSGGTCFLITTSQERLDLNMPSTCRFHRLVNGEIQVRKGHHGPVFLVGSSVKDATGTDCDTRIAAVTIADGNTYIEPAVSGVKSCLVDKSLDDIYFLAPRFEGLAYPDHE